MADPKSPLSTKDDKSPNLDNLPELVYSDLFEYLDLDDVCVLKLVSKKLNKIGKEYKVRELYFIPKEYHEDKDNHFDNSWFSTSKSIKFIYHLDSLKLSLLIDPSKNLLNLRCLKIEVCPALFDLDALNKFIKLQILELLKLEIDFDYRLKLPELRAFSIRFGTNYSGSLEIDAPELHSLKIDYKFSSKLANNEIKFKNLLSIKYLSALQFNDSLLVFKSLECLKLNEDNQRINLDILKFDHLKKLETNSLLDDQVDALRHLFKSNKRDDLAIVLYGVKIKEVDKIDEYMRTSDKLKFQFDNYRTLEDDLNNYTHINYADLISYIRYYQPPDLFKKYNNIQWITISAEIKNENHSIEFIAKCQNLYHLTINTIVTQKFYDKLPRISSLARLEITDYCINLNFKFLKYMPDLTYFCASNIVVMKKSNDSYLAGNIYFTSDDLINWLGNI